MSQGGQLSDNTSGAADVEFLTGDAGGAIGPDAAHNINLLGTAAQGISTSGAGNTITFTISDATTAQKGVSELATDAEAIAGSDTGRTIVPSSLTAKLGTQTQYGLPIGAGTTAAITWTAAATNGQLLIGNTGANPTLATLTEGPGIHVTNGSGAVTVGVYGGGFTWQTIGASQTLAVNNAYICNAGATLNLALPTTCAVGDMIEVLLDGSTAWNVTQAAGQQVRVGTLQTTAGVGGSIGSNNQGDWIQILCVVANTTFTANVKQGNVTIT